MIYVMSDIHGQKRRFDSVMSQTSELSHLFRSLKAPAAAKAMPKLAERAREESWSFERFTEALLSTEVGDCPMKCVSGGLGCDVRGCRAFDL